MKRELEQAVAAAVKELFGTDVPVELSRPDEQFGDYATNVALQLAKPLGKNPREIAEALRDKLATDGRLQSVEVAGPGFLNLKLADQTLVTAAALTPAKSLTGRQIVAEYSDPNPFKILHAGHLYTSLVGDSIARLLQAAGAEVHRVNFGGDVGLHVAKTMWAILQELGGENPGKLHEIPVNQKMNWISGRYVIGNNAYEEDPAAKAAIVEINKRVYKLHEQADHDSDFAKIYWLCRRWSYDGFEELYSQLQMVQFEKYYPESQTTNRGVAAVEQGLERGVFKESNGAVVFDGEAVGLHTRVFITSEGLPTYEAKDLGLALTKWDDYHFDQSFIITGNDIVEYMKVVQSAVSHFEPEAAQRTVHLTHGQVKLMGGVKMSSRKGNILTAMEILDAAREAGQATGTNPSEDTLLAAVKYAFAKNRIGGDIIYDPKESIALEGNSGPYLQYAHARARSILAKAGKGGGELTDLTADERSLLRKITEYAEVVEKATSELMPHHICTYLYELAQKFNQFYEHNRVVGDGRESARLSLVAHYADTLKNGLELLGITAPDKM